MNPGMVGINPGVVGLNGGLLSPGLVVGGVNPALIGGGGAFIGQPPIGPVRTSSFFINFTPNAKTTPILRGFPS